MGTNLDNSNVGPAAKRWYPPPESQAEACATTGVGTPVGRGDGAVSSDGSDNVSPPPSGGSTRPFRRAVAVVVILLALSVVVVADTGAWNAAWSATVGHENRSALLAVKVQFDQGLRQLQAQVRPGHTIYLDVPDSAIVWTQRLAEFAAMGRLTVVSDRAQADYVVTVVEDRSTPGSVRLVARPTR
jgi:hypothetical protein